MSYNILDVISKELAEELDLNRTLGENEVIEFRHIRAGRVDPNSSKGFSTPTAHILPGKDLIVDKYDKKHRQKLVMNIVDYRPVQEVGKPLIMDPVDGSVKFGPSGSIFCTANDMNQFLFMRIMNKNGSNPNRIKTKPVVFTEVNEVKELSIKNSYFDYRALASGVILKAEERGDEGIIDIATKILRTYPQHYSFDIKSDVKKLKASIAHVAETQPLDFIMAVKEPMSYARVLVDDAIDNKRIFFDDHTEKQAWCWKRNSIEKGKKVIVKVEGEKNPLKGLIDFLQTKEGSEHMFELKQLGEENYSKPLR